MANPAQMKTLHTVRDREKRKRLILLVHILRQYLRKHNMPRLHQQVQIFVRDCHAGHLRGDPALHPLADVIETRLRLLVNNNIWTQVILCLELYGLSPQSHPGLFVPSHAYREHPPSLRWRQRRQGRRQRRPAPAMWKTGVVYPSKLERETKVRWMGIFSRDIPAAILNATKGCLQPLIVRILVTPLS